MYCPGTGLPAVGSQPTLGRGVLLPASPRRAVDPAGALLVSGHHPRQAFTLGIASVDHVRRVDYFGLASRGSADRFAAAGVTAVRADTVDAPYDAVFPMVLECHLRQAVELGVHTLFIGEVLDLKADEALLGPGGPPDLERCSPCRTPRGRRPTSRWGRRPGAAQAKVRSSPSASATGRSQVGQNQRASSGVPHSRCSKASLLPARRAPQAASRRSAPASSAPGPLRRYS